MHIGPRGRMHSLTIILMSTPQAMPLEPQPEEGVVHAWALEGYLSKNIHTGQLTALNSNVLFLEGPGNHTIRFFCWVIN